MINAQAGLYCWGIWGRVELASGPMREISTPRLVLEPLTGAHAEEMFLVLSDPAIYEFENAPPPSEEWLLNRYRLLELRRSTDGEELWLNWVVRSREGGGLIGYVQATVRPDPMTLVAYEFESSSWGRGLGRESVGAVLDELSARYHVGAVAAILKKTNHRSRTLLGRLGFDCAPDRRAGYGAEDDEDVYVRSLDQ